MNIDFIRFLSLRLFRDKKRSLMPFITIMLSTLMLFFAMAWMNGMTATMLEGGINFSTGHLEINTKGYRDLAVQRPIDLSISNASAIQAKLKIQFPDYDWVKRMDIGGLLDVADEQGETVTQTPAHAIALDFLGENHSDIKRLKIQDVLTQGRLPKTEGEALLSEVLLNSLAVKIGDTVSFISSDPMGSMFISNFQIVGTLSFGIASLDKTTFFVDINDLTQSMYFEGGASKILGYQKSASFIPPAKELNQIALLFNEQIAPDFITPETHDKLKLQMYSIFDNFEIATMLKTSEASNWILASIFALTIVVMLWNSSLLASIRRYGDFGIRLALGETRQGIYISLLLETFIVSSAAAIAGIILGLIPLYFSITHGLSLEDSMESTVASGASFIVPNRVYAAFSWNDVFFSIAIAMFSAMLGSLLAGRTIFKRDISQLFKEMER